MWLINYTGTTDGIDQEWTRRTLLLLLRKEVSEVNGCHYTFPQLSRRSFRNQSNSGMWEVTSDLKDWWCRDGRGNAVKTRRVELAVVSWPLPKNYSSRSYESSLDGAASECSNK
ncbi:hypothetical protein TNCV_4446121 [Trichonephila clavipes]|nr:hypothetical protein TNCV_4446121 [Trichonephila clavipes]